MDELYPIYCSALLGTVALAWGVLVLPVLDDMREYATRARQHLSIRVGDNPQSVEIRGLSTVVGLTSGR